jgi:hypothetical protein
MNIKVSELQQLLEAIEKNNISISEAIKLIDKTSKEQSKSEEEISLTVDYGQTLEQMIANGKYNWHNSNITEKNFPLPAGLVGEKIVVSAKLFYFSSVISSKEAIAEMNKDGYRPATLAELLALGEARPDLQRQFPILALGSVWRDVNGYHHVSCLGVNDLERELSLYWFGSDWDASCRFLAVRKCFVSRSFGRVFKITFSNHLLFFRFLIRILIEVDISCCLKPCFARELEEKILKSQILPQLYLSNAICYLYWHI